MKLIYFQSEKELIYFCELIFQKLQTIHVEWNRSKHFGHELKLFTHDLDKEVMVTCFKELFFQMRLDRMLQEVLEKVYYYTDYNEINHISSITKAMIVETLTDDGFTELLTSLFRRYLWNSESIHYDAMVLFSNKALTASLTEMVGYGIDEVKLEEAHQYFITSARTFLVNRPLQTNTIYIVQGETFDIYKRNGKKYAALELRTAMLDTPLYMIGLDENEWNLSPVIALNPKKIYIYGDNPSEAKTVSLMNVFEERVQFLPLDQFPFRQSK